MSYTPGPLTAGLDMPIAANKNPDPRLIWSGTKFLGHAISSWIAPEEQEANARLWAAAPELLQACKDLIGAMVDATGSNCHCPCGCPENGPCAGCRARAAIAKAEGKPCPIP